MTRLRTKASLFGVGTPEVLVIGVVALLVFGPKGLADAAKSLGKTLRTFQPTIQELKEVSEEFKTTLEDEIGLDEFKTSMRGTGGSASRPYRASDEEKESNLEEMRRESAAAAWGGDAGEGTAGRSEEPAAPTPTFEESLSAPDAEGDGTSSDLSNLSVEELQAELERRKNEQ
ncbi:TatB-like sec-independent protein translocon protein [Chloropicon primus]|uniref:TatB-like sec-independent protein translocon protein n=1 Tax=Chloropicon primus TaxID=1764295 RepID=A0A5B8N1G4_9CHLO|nr:TatB-like sec-independent protein translocon protein [Chloropicon primus]UPR04911.1 TatB-like sec-independent protein translocon protein [Chloropicon primus]|eukprot:QDZ25715.1 TatB-like sec-independent protein translocon protein [Chloropicon primus]